MLMIESEWKSKADTQVLCACLLLQFINAPVDLALVAF